MNVTINQAQILLEVWCFLFSIICAIVLIVTRYKNQSQDKIQKMIFLNISALFFDILGRSLYSADATTDVLFFLKKLGYMTVFEIGYLMINAIIEYTLSNVTDIKEWDARICRIISCTLVVAGTLCLVVTQFNGLYYFFDSDGIYHRNPGFMISIFIGQAGSLVVLFILQKYRKSIKASIKYAIYGYLIFPIIAMVLSLRYYGISYINFATTVSVIIIFTVNAIDVSKTLAEKSEKLLEMEKLQNEWKISALRAQIQPHFLFNTLNTIKYLCKKDPEEASVAIDKLSAFLRGSVDSVESSDIIYFENEISIIENYVYLEKKRFGDRVKVIYEIEDKDFAVPALSLQPLVENAIKHGICQRIDGGTVTLSSKFTEKGHMITIADDGVGFDTNLDIKDGRTHVGLKNSIMRLKTICNATVDVESKPESGTLIKIIIPKDEK